MYSVSACIQYSLESPMGYEILSIQPNHVKVFHFQHNPSSQPDITQLQYPTFTQTHGLAHFIPFAATAGFRFEMSKSTVAFNTISDSNCLQIDDCLYLSQNPNHSNEGGRWSGDAATKGMKMSGRGMACLRRQQMEEWEGDG
ncbi:hypothetical protein ACOSQ3_002072 [Xanthoceras sorbifolium]